MEFDLGLLKDETYGLYARYVWEASRYKLQNYLNRKFSLHGFTKASTVQIRQMSLSFLFCFIGRFVYSIIVKNWLWAPKKRDWLIFQFIRHREFSGGGYEDIFTDDIIDEIGIDKCVIIERPYQRRHYTLQRHKVFHSEFISLLNKFFKLFSPFYFRYDLTSINNMIHDIEKYLEEKLEQEKIDLENRIDKKSLFIKYLSYKFMLKWLNPRKILVVVSGQFTPLIWAASTLHIPTVELQHGVIASEHLMYSFPTGNIKKLFPDYFLLFGNYWKELVDNLPLVPERLITLGYPYFERMLLENNNLVKREDQIVIISQGTIGRELSEFAVKLALIKKGIYKIIYKLHPYERGRAQKMYTELYEAKEQGLLDVVDTDTPALYTLFSQSRWQIGVYSTALYEGIALGCQLILVDLPGVEYMVPLLKKGNVQIVKDPEEIQFRETEDFMALREDMFAGDWRSNWQRFEQMDLKCRF